MLQYDLSSTSLVEAASAVKMPSEGELSALTVALLVATQLAFRDLERHEVSLTSDNVDKVTVLLERGLSPLLSDFAHHGDVRARIREFIGLRVSGVAEVS